jgi:periplasmic protein TonB
MNRRFFDDLLESSTRRTRKGGRKLTLPVSIAVHAVILFAVIVVPYLRYNEMPEPALGTVHAFFVEPVAAPPPPPPPPAPPKAAVAAPKISKPKPVVIEPPKFTAPVEVPKELPRDEGVSAASVADSAPAAGAAGGEPGGVEGGVPGGVAGGVPGGIVGGVLGGLPREEPPPPPDKPVRVGGQIKAPRKVRDAAPSYPDVAKQARVEGVVILEAVINPQGRVTEVKVLRGSPLLDDAAVNAVKGWVYTPTLLNGVPVPVVMTVTVTFKLS